MIVIFTDGACSGNPGPGGWGCVAAYADGKVRELGGGEANTTNNRMEMTAVLRALQALKAPCDVTLHTDSRYVIDGMTKWIHGWQKNGWKTAAKKPVLNAELWQELIAVARPHAIDWRWVKGHAGHAENERVDQLASQAALSVKGR